MDRHSCVLVVRGAAEQEGEGGWGRGAGEGDSMTTLPPSSSESYNTPITKIKL